MPARGRGAPLGAHERADLHNATRRRANTIRVRVLTVVSAAAPALVVGVGLGAGVGAVPGALGAAVLFVALVVLVSTVSMPVALHLVGAGKVTGAPLPALVNQIEGLCATLGVVQPELRVVDDDVANACTLAGRGGRAVLVVTSGLLAQVGIIEMEGVVAHELVHLKRRDAEVSSLALATVGLLAWVSGRDQLVHAALGRGREYEADQAAALAVRYPPGLHDALAAMGERSTASGRSTGPRRSSRGPSPFSGRRWAATRWIWIDPMVGAATGAPTGELDATAVRVDALGEW